MGGYAQFIKSEAPEIDATLVRLLVKEVLKDASEAAKRGEHIDYARVQVHRHLYDFPADLREPNDPDEKGLGYYFGTLPANFLPPDEQEDPVFSENKVDNS